MTVTKANIETLDYMYLGSPYCDVPGQDALDTQTLDYMYLGAPFVGALSGAAPAATSIKKIMGVAQASVKKYNGVALASIKKVNSVSNV